MMHDGMMMGEGMMMGGPMMLMGFVLMILVIVALIVGIVWLVRALTQDGDSARRRSAIEELELRYARGDLDRDEYFQRREDLARG